MLRSLRIKNIALIEQCTIEFGENLNVLSGETGAGKSIIIDSLSFALGARADKTLIRHGEKTAEVEAVFDLSDSPAAKAVMVGFGLEEEDLLIVFRSMTENKSEIRLNGRPATLSMLKEITRLLVDILSQHENQSLLSVSSHIELLDKYGESSLLRLKNTVSELFDSYKETENALGSFGSEADRARKMDILSYQIDEIAAAELKEGEEEELLAERERFRNSEKIVSAVSTAASAMNGDDAFSVQSAISAAMNALRSVVSYDKTLEETYDRLDQSYAEIKDLSDELSSYVDSFDFDEATAAYVEKRVDQIRSLKRKYGSTVSEILRAYDDFSKEYAVLSDADGEVERLTKKKGELYEKLMQACAELSEKRKKTAKAFSAEIEKELSELGMKGSKFEVSFASGEAYLTENGFDKVEFLISPNPGEPLRELAKIISGGEMSRFMLALKVITARLDGIGTLVFDEVDAGISGHIGEVVAEKLVLVSRVRQVLTITHLPQVAAVSDRHFLIEKKTTNGKTLSSVTPLEEEGVLKEIERLSAGVGAYGALHAKELRDLAKQKKAN